MNSVTITGHLGRDPETTTLPSGTTVSNFSVAVNDIFRKGDEKTEKTHWFTVKAFGKLAELVNTYLSKGKKVGIIGRLNYEEWDSDTGKRSKVTIIADKLEFMSPRTVEAEETDKEPF
jgi:single-strand DNA-binding protein